MSVVPREPGVCDKPSSSVSRLSRSVEMVLRSPVTAVTSMVPVVEIRLSAKKGEISSNINTESPKSLNLLRSVRTGVDCCCETRNYSLKGGQLTTRNSRVSNIHASSSNDVVGSRRRPNKSGSREDDGDERSKETEMHCRGVGSEEVELTLRAPE